MVTVMLSKVLGPVSDTCLHWLDELSLYTCEAGNILVFSPVQSLPLSCLLHVSCQGFGYTHQWQHLRSVCYCSSCDSRILVWARGGD